jgi:DNA-binding transcriptional ArsR family regulator
MSKRAPKTILEVCLARAGVMKGARVQSFISLWSMASQRLGRPITVTDYAEYYGESERNVYRHLRSFREVFPSVDTPQPIADAVIAQAEDRVYGKVGDVGLLPAGLLPA